MKSFGEFSMYMAIFPEEDVLKRANAKYASKALILGEEDDGLTPELIDSRVFAAMLMLKGMNPKIHICAQVQTKKYKNYLESNKCDEVIYSGRIYQVYSFDGHSL